MALSFLCEEQIRPHSAKLGVPFRAGLLFRLSINTGGTHPFSFGHRVGRESLTALRLTSN